MKRIYLFLTLLLLVAACQRSPLAEPEERLSVATLNVDGLPEKILFLNVNPDGPGHYYTSPIGAFLLEENFDFIATQENFNYAQVLFNLMDATYEHDQWQGGINLSKTDIQLYPLMLKTDGLVGFWKTDAMRCTAEKATAWNEAYGLVHHASDELAAKGFRRMEMALSSGTKVVFYNLHMDASEDADELTGADAPDQEVRLKQWDQLLSDILQHLDSRPIIILGDTNSFYEHDPVKAHFFDVINESGKATAHDVRLELNFDGVFPEYRKSVVTDADRNAWMLQGEMLDKIIYINPLGGVQLEPLDYKVHHQNYVRDDGITPLGDHFPVSATFRVKK